MSAIVEPKTDWRAALNDQQRRAAEFDQGPLIVLAGPGTGKTRTLIARIRHILERGAEPDSILALTFSVRAAEEMRQRLASEIAPGVADRTNLWTFHSYGARLVARFGDMIGTRRELVLMDSAHQRRVLRGLLREHGLFTHEAARGETGVIDEARHYISQCKNGAQTPEAVSVYTEQWRSRLETNEAGLVGDELDAERFLADRFGRLATLFGHYDEACLNEGLVTFDDYLSLPTRIFSEHSATRSIVRSEIRHVLVDEFQDVNAAQIELLRQIAPPEGDPGRTCDLCVVGDDDQAIYGFRGADTQAFDRFARIWTSYETIALTKNYRSRREIIDVANSVIDRCEARFMPDKVIEAAGADDRSGGAIEGVTVERDNQLGIAIASMILDDKKKNPERSWESYGVLTRTNGTADDIALELELHGIPVAVRRITTPLDDPGIQDLLAWMRLAAGLDQSRSVLRLLMRPPLQISLEQVDQWRRAWERKKDDSTLLDFLRSVTKEDQQLERFVDEYDAFRSLALTLSAEQFIAELIGRVDVIHNDLLSPIQPDARLRHVIALRKFAQAKQPVLEPPGDMGSFWTHYDQLDPAEQQFEVFGDERLDRRAGDQGDGGDSVQVITAHQAKGLEFDTVFVARARPGWGFPYTMGGMQNDFEDLPAAFTDAQPASRADEERRLFYVACTRAERRLVLLAKSRKGKSRSIDYYDEIREHAPSLGLAQHEARDLIDSAGLHLPETIELQQLDRDRQTLLRRERQRAQADLNVVLHDAQQKDISADAIELLAGRSSEVTRRLAALSGLASAGTLPEWAQDDEQLRAVAERYAKGRAPVSLVRAMIGPLDVSYSRVMDYERCPRCFYTRYVLGLREEQTVALGLGTLVHSALEQFFREVQRAEGEGETAPTIDRLLKIADGIVARDSRPDMTMEPEIVAQAKAQLRVALEQLHDESDNVLEVEQSIKFRYPCPLGKHDQGHKFTAKIDRIDQLASGPMRIVDYKTGKVTKSKLEPKKDDLQLAIYAMALREFMGEGKIEDAPIRGLAEYWMLSEGKRGSIELEDLKLDKARTRIDKAITGMLTGAFEKGKHCGGLCDILPE